MYDTSMTFDVMYHFLMKLTLRPHDLQHVFILSYHVAMDTYCPHCIWKSAAPCCLNITHHQMFGGNMNNEVENEFFKLL